MNEKLLWLFGSLVTVFASCEAAIARGGAVIPTYTDPCKRSSPDFNGCIKRTLQELLPKFSKGIPELNISALDPFYLEEYLLNYDAGDIAGKCLYKNVYTSGLSGIQILDIRSTIDDPNYLELELDFYFPKVTSTGSYKAEGHVGNFPVQGKGVFNVSGFNVTGTVHLIGHAVTLDGQKHMKISDLRLTHHEIGDAKIFATNLINGNPELSRTALTFINQFWRILHQLMLPNIEEGFEKVGRPFVNQLFLQIPYDQLLPPNKRK